MKGCNCNRSDNPEEWSSRIRRVLRALGVDRLVEKHMPSPGSNRGKRPWQFIELLMLMVHGSGRHREEVREIRDDTGLRRLMGAEEHGHRGRAVWA